MRLGIKDHKVLRAFTERKAADGLKLYTNGRTLHFYGLGGGDPIAEWKGGRIHFGPLSGLSRASVVRALRKHAAPVDLYEHYLKVKKRAPLYEHYLKVKKRAPSKARTARDTKWDLIDRIEARNRKDKIASHHRSGLDPKGRVHVSYAFRNEEDARNFWARMAPAFLAERKGRMVTATYNVSLRKNLGTNSRYAKLYGAKISGKRVQRPFGKGGIEFTHNKRRK